MEDRVKKCCRFCVLYRHEEIGDSDYGAVYSEFATCSKYLDTDPETEEDIPNFDRESERDCCELDFWRVVEVDRVLSFKFDTEVGINGDFKDTYQFFKERYNLNKPL